MGLVKIVHPEAGEAEVPASAVPHWRSSGWVPADEVEGEKADDGGSPAGGEPEQESKPSGRSRRRSSEGDKE